MEDKGIIKEMEILAKAREIDNAVQVMTGMVNEKKREIEELMLGYVRNMYIGRFLRKHGNGMAMVPLFFVAGVDYVRYDGDGRGFTVSFKGDQIYRNNPTFLGEYLIFHDGMDVRMDMDGNLFNYVPDVDAGKEYAKVVEYCEKCVDGDGCPVFDNGRVAFIKDGKIHFGYAKSYNEQTEMFVINDDSNAKVEVAGKDIRRI